MSHTSEERQVTSLAFHGVGGADGVPAYRIAQPFLVEIGAAVVLTR